MDASDVDHNFEPQTRARSNTWPLRPSRELDPQSSPASEDSNADGQIKAEKDPLGLTAKKSGSRRNAWGNLSYADLITKAIQSSSEKRLTLSQIYDWMVQNVPYFKDKGDSTSSAGWKVSVFLFVFLCHGCAWQAAPYFHFQPRCARITLPPNFCGP